ncbi:uncharacterized protein LOC141649426 [Silene latifolia]|uniref:uncharacterized protein LOC141649426 n=1 Tax=Silene latifolia TaxID=37657 RepID=UPI003D777776
MEIWDGLELAYEGTTILKKYRINMLIQNYELFTMEPNESLDSMFARFSSIINELKNLARKFEFEDIARKVLRRDLMAYELVLDKDEAELSKGKSMALHDSTSENVESDIEDETKIKDKTKCEKTKKEFKQVMLGSCWGELDTEDDEGSEDKEVVSHCLSNHSLDKCHEQDLELKDLKEQILDIAEENQLLKAKAKKLKSKVAANIATTSKSANVKKIALESKVIANEAINSELKHNIKHLQEPRSSDTVIEENGFPKPEPSSNDERNNNFRWFYDLCFDYNKRVNEPKQPQKPKESYKTKAPLKQPEKQPRCGERNNLWYLDSSCSRHMTGDINLFLSLKPFDGGKVTFGDNKKGKIVGVGQDEEEDMNEPYFRLSRDDPPKLGEEDKEIEGTNDELGSPSNDKGKRDGLIVDDPVTSSQNKNLETEIITDEAITLNLNQGTESRVIPDSATTPGLDTRGTILRSQSFEEGEPSSNDNDVPPTSNK